MLPPVSDPRASVASPAATAAVDPPLVPPGTRVSSQGFRVGPYAEFSVLLPIANSSQLALPMMIAPARRRRVTTVASYGGRNPWRMRDPHVVGQFRVQMLSFSATGIPARGGASS